MKNIDNKGQGALEYIILIGGAIIVAAIVLAILLRGGASSKTEAMSGIGSAEESYGGLEEILEEVEESGSS